jgi:hypothetical protein
MDILTVMGVLAGVNGRTNATLITSAIVVLPECPLVHRASAGGEGGRGSPRSGRACPG